MKYKKSLVSVAILLAGVAQAGIAGAIAQTSAAGEGDIIVTATRRAQSLQDVPMSVNVATGDQLQKLNLFDAKDVQQLSPGLELTNSDGRSNTATLRGVAFNPDQGTSPAVDLYFNEIPIDSQTAFTALYDIDQIEVLRGPQGALRGRTAPAGAITIRTRRANLNDIEGYAQATATEDNAYNVQGGVSLPIIPGKLALRAAMLVDGNRINQVYNVNRNQYSRSRTESARLSLAWAPSDTLTVNAMYQYLFADNRQNQQVIGAGNTPTIAPGTGLPVPTRNGPVANTDDYIAVHEGIRRYQNESHLFTLAADWDLGPVTLAFVGGHQDTLLTQNQDQDVANSIPNYINNQRTISPYIVNTAELRLSSSDSGFWNWSIGGFYSKQTGDNTSGQNNDVFFGNFPASAGLFLPIGVDLLIPQYIENISLAASNSFQLSDKLRLELAARYSRLTSKQFSEVTVSVPGRPPTTSPLVNPALAVSRSHPLTGGATLTYEFSPAATAYAAYGRSFRGSTAGVGVPQNITNDLVRSKPERSDAVEVGLKTAFFNRRLMFDVGAFYQKFDNYISRFASIYYDYGTPNAFGVASGPPDGIVDGFFPSGFNYNGDATIKGVEATLSGRPIENWDFTLNAAYARGRYDDAQLPCNDFNGDGAPDATGVPAITGSGNVSYCANKGRIGEVPDFSFNANSELRFPMGAVEPFVRGLFTYRPGFHSEVANYDYKSRELLNLYLGVRHADAGWEINVFAKNLLNQKTVTRISQGIVNQPTRAAPYVSGYRIINATNPRELGVTAMYRF